MPLCSDSTKTREKAENDATFGSAAPLQAANSATFGPCSGQIGGAHSPAGKRSMLERPGPIYDQILLFSLLSWEE